MADPLPTVSATLWTTASQLLDLINDPDTSDPVRSAAQDEFLEVNHRINCLAKRALSEQIDLLTKKAAAVDDAQGRLDEVLAQVQTAADVVQGVTSFLTAVDDFIDTAKAFFV